LKNGLLKYIEETDPSRKLLVSSLEQLGIDTESDDKTELIRLLEHQISNLGLEYILLNLPLKFLHEIATEAQLNIKTTSKNLLVRHLVDMTDYIPTPRKSSTPSPHKQASPKSKSKSESPHKKKKLKPDDFILVFESSDSEDWTPPSEPNKEDEDISIPDEDNGDLDSSSEEDRYESSDDNYSGNEYERKSSKRHQEKSLKKRSSHQKNHKREDSSEDKAKRRKVEKNSKSSEKSRKNKD